MMIKKQINLSQRLFIELGTSLLLKPEAPEESVSGELIGMKVGHYLIVQVPAVTVGKMMLSVGQGLQVKYICSGDVFGFRSRIITATSEPDNLLYLEYPDKVESRNVRSCERIDCFLAVQVMMEGITGQGTIVNMSRQGCRCLVDSKLHGKGMHKKTISISFQYAPREHLTLTGMVTGVEQTGEQYSLGILFDEIDNFSKSVLATLVPALK